MPILQLIKEYRFDLAVADVALRQNECKDLVNTFQRAVPAGKGNQAIERIIIISQNRKIAIRHSKNQKHVDFQHYLQYLYKRAE